MFELYFTQRCRTCDEKKWFVSGFPTTQKIPRCTETLVFLERKRNGDIDDADIMKL